MSDLSKVDLNLLVALGALLDERNLTRAGERIGMTQPAMSGSLGRLRKLLDDEILIRQGRGYELSSLAESLLPTVHEALAQIERTLQGSKTFDPATSDRKFTISISDYALSILNEPLQRLLQEEAPGVDIDFDAIPQDRDELQSHLLRRDLIIAGAKLGVPGQRQAIFRDRFVCVASADNPLITSDEISLEDLAHLPYVMGSFGEHVATPPDLALEAVGITPRVAVAASGLLALPFLVADTDMISFVPERLAQRCLQPLNLRVIDTPLEVAPLVESAHWHPMNSHEASLRWLLDILRQVSLMLRAS